MTKLEQCPFCWGQDAMVAVVDCKKIGPAYFDKYAVLCPTCGAQGPICDDSQEALARWNIRGPVDEGLIKYIEEVRKT